ncbi:DUF4145 domain-containing protein [Nocardia sp. CA-128927]|uniref:DUF4145 domain-containing protein n=1 Tax=Nocardia sp. CA-128927 TaxID=3239975 RepID=UPI003D96C18C
MKEQVRRLAEWFSRDEWPVLECPSCRVGTLGAIKSVGNRATADWHEWEGDPSDIEGIFFGHLKCTNRGCGDVVAAAGDYTVDPGGPPGQSWFPIYRVRTLYPAVRVVETSELVPESVRGSLERAAAVAWQDPSAGISLLRNSIERLMDEQGIVAVDAKGNFRSLHRRLEEFDAIRHDAAELLLAAKWVGNEGTHPAGLEAKDFLDVAEFVELALEVLYEKDTSVLRKRVRRIINAKKLVP